MVSNVTFAGARDKRSSGKIVRKCGEFAAKPLESGR
jgi:hypothetical protein